MGDDLKAVVQRSILNIPFVRRPAFTEAINGAWARANESGDRADLHDLIRYAAVATEDVETKKRIEGRMATVNSLRDVRETLERYAAIDENTDAPTLPTNWLLGNIENLYRQVGTSTDPQYVELANRLMGTLINYRRAATGVQFGQKEAEQYELMFPKYTNTPEVNLSLIDGLLDEMDSYDSTYWRHRLGERGAELIGMIRRPGRLSGPTTGADLP